MPQRVPTEEHAGVDRLSRPDVDRPVLHGLLALVGVGLAIGLLAALGALLVTEVTGLGGDTEAAVTETEDTASMFLPTPEPTGRERGPGPLVSVAPQAPEKQPDDPSSTAAAAAGINLSSGQTSVSPMQRIDLTGTYPSGEGAVLQVQRKSGGSWGDFPVTASVSGGTFSTYVQTSQTGRVRFRVVDSDSGAKSNPVTVRIG